MEVEPVGVDELAGLAFSALGVAAGTEFGVAGVAGVADVVALRESVR